MCDVIKELCRCVECYEPYLHYTTFALLDMSHTPPPTPTPASQVSQVV